MRRPRDPGSDPRAALGRRALRPHFVQVRRWLRAPRQLRPTRAGWSFFALTFGVGFAALNTGNNLLYLVLSAMLAFLVLSGVLSESALRGCALRRRLPRELAAERESWVEVEVHNTQRRVSAYALVIEDRIRTGSGEAAAGRATALRVEPGARQRCTYRLRPEHRGELIFEGFVVSTRFPFGLFSKSLSIRAPERALVYPACDPVELPPDFGAAREAGEALAGPRGHGGEVGGIREYRRGDAPRRIDWRTTLRSRGLWVREVHSHHEGEVEVRLRTAGRREGEDFERAVRSSASDVVAFVERGLRVGLRTDAEHIDADAGPHQRARLLAFLARVGPAEEPA